MPILELARRYTPGSGMRRIGKIVKGAPRTPEDIDKRRPGKDLTHFRFNPDAGFEGLEQAFIHLYGEEPDVISGALLLADSVDNVFATWHEEWGSGGLLRRCDGDRQARIYDPAQGRAVNCTLPCIASAAHPCACKPVGRLTIMLPEFAAATGVVGTFVIETHSTIDVAHMYNALRDTLALYGRLTGIPIDIARVPRELYQPEIDRKTKEPTGRRIKVVKHLIWLSVSAEHARQTLAPDAPKRTVDQETGEIIRAADALPEPFSEHHASPPSPGGAAEPVKEAEPAMQNALRRTYACINIRIEQYGKQRRMLLLDADDEAEDGVPFYALAFTRQKIRDVITEADHAALGEAAPNTTCTLQTPIIVTAEKQTAGYWMVISVSAQDMPD